MADYPIIDAHVHTYKSREIGRQAMAGAASTDYGGTPDELLALMQRGGIEKAVMVNMTPVFEMVEAALAKLPLFLAGGERAAEEERIRSEIIGRLQRRNEWTCAVGREHPQLVPFIGLDPSMGGQELVAEVDRRVAEGARGIKLHPPNQRFFPDDPRLSPLYEHAQARGLPIVYHSGTFALGPGRNDHGHPRHFAKVATAFPRLTIVMGHMAFGDFDACAALAREHANVFFDCCYVINGTQKAPTLSDDEAAAAIRQAGAGRVMFGSDFPWLDPLLDSQRIQRLALSDDEKRAVLHDNAVRILGL
jgi:predicted TIM-barrel fold metal-dependent hydrolase